MFILTDKIIANRIDKVIRTNSYGFRIVIDTSRVDYVNYMK